MIVEEALETLQQDPQNSAAWEVIVLSVYQPLVAYVASLLISFRVAPETSAPDVVHDVLLSFYERWSMGGMPFKSEAALAAYFKKSCRNRLVDKYRHDQHAQQFLDFLNVRFSTAFHDSKPHESIFINEIINMLPDECGSLMKEFVYNDLSAAEIAEKLGESPRKLRSRWYRCIAKAKLIFADILKKEEDSARL